MSSIELTTALRQWLESWERAGLTELLPAGESPAALVEQLRALATSSSQAITTDRPLAENTSPNAAVQPAKVSTVIPSTATASLSRTTQSVSVPDPIPTADEMPRPKATPKVSPVAPVVTAVGSASLIKQAPLAAAARLPALEIIRREVEHCTRCEELASGRHKTVFGVGDPNAKLCFVGEAPGADEDEQGEPFVGRAGQLLTKIIEACQLSRSQVWICNVLKCRPPNNRPPEPNEVANCRGYLDRQLEIVRPEVIVCLGATAAKCLLNTELSIGKLRGKWHDYRGLQVYCTYHPAYLLRNPNAKRDVWEDMKVVMARLGVQLA